MRVCNLIKKKKTSYFSRISIHGLVFEVKCSNLHFAIYFLKKINQNDVVLRGAKKIYGLKHIYIQWRIILPVYSDMDEIFVFFCS